jgi:hypothetical protein
MKVVISYDMNEGREQEAQDYLVNKLAPGLAKLGFRVSDVWYTVWGSSPQITSGGEVETVEKAQDIFYSKEWKKLEAGMGELTRNFKVRLVKSSRAGLTPPPPD